MRKALEALERLKEGNRRFAECDGTRDSALDLRKCQELVEGQAPFAVVLGCSDSRVPVEIIFDQGPGDLFVIRIAGNIVAPSGIGSIEFAAARFGTRLVVVMGHTSCGAVQATLEEMQRPTEVQSKNLQFIVNRIRPNVERVLASELRHRPDELIRQAVRDNVRASVEALRHGSDILEDLVTNDDLLIVGAEYSLETGRVEFFDDRP